jgi:hypothetical protein
VTTYAADSFTGADDTEWSTGIWAAGNSTAASWASKKNNQGQMDAGSVPDYEGKCARVLVGTSVVPARVQTRVTFRFAVDGSVRCYLRADAPLDDRTGYVMTMNRATQTVRIYRVVNYDALPLGSVSYTIAQDVPHEIDFQALGSQIKLWVWPASGSKPSTPTLQATDSAITAPGSIGLLAVGGASPWFKVDFDNFVASDGQGEMLLIGSATATGTLLRRPQRRFTGSTSSSGALSMSKVVLRTFTGSTTAGGALLRARLRTLTGSATATGIVRRTPHKMVAGATTASGVMLRGVLRTLTGSTTAVGSLVPQFLGRIVGDAATVQMTARALSWVRITARRWTS